MPVSLNVMSDGKATPAEYRPFLAPYPEQPSIKLTERAAKLEQQLGRRYRLNH